MNKQIKRNKVESTKQSKKGQPLCQVETDVRCVYTLYLCYCLALS